tara:strand:+ start:5172 stop:5408 length:237 start_codon:yes stop_codon:yes gene_type:complete
MTPEEAITKYATDRNARTSIDKLLHSNSVVQSSLGIDSTQEEKDEANKLTTEIAYEIYEICPLFAKEIFIEINFHEAL